MNTGSASSTPDRIPRARRGPLDSYTVDLLSRLGVNTRRPSSAESWKEAPSSRPHRLLLLRPLHVVALWMIVILSHGESPLSENDRLLADHAEDLGALFRHWGLVLTTVHSHGHRRHRVARCFRRRSSLFAVTGVASASRTICPTTIAVPLAVSIQFMYPASRFPRPPGKRRTGAEVMHLACKNQRFSPSVPSGANKSRSLGSKNWER